VGGRPPTPPGAACGRKSWRVSTPPQHPRSGLRPQSRGVSTRSPHPEAACGRRAGVFQPAPRAAASPGVFQPRVAPSHEAACGRKQECFDQRCAPTPPVRVAAANSGVVSARPPHPAMRAAAAAPAGLRLEIMFRFQSLSASKDSPQISRSATSHALTSALSRPRAPHPAPWMPPRPGVPPRPAHHARPRPHPPCPAPSAHRVPWAPHAARGLCTALQTSRTTFPFSPIRLRSARARALTVKRVFNRACGGLRSDQWNVYGSTDRDHELITHRAWTRPAFVVEMCHGPDEVPGMTGRYPRATSRGRRVRPARP
jgi:hypothetical protein